MSDVYFNGPVGRIEGRYRNSGDKTSPIALILHPDPLQGGTMNNKATYTVFSAFADVGFTVLRINFPGIGRSEGVPGNGSNEFRAASCALDWLENNNPEASHCWVGGFSFGTWISMQLATRRPEIEQFALLAPPSGKYDYSFAAPCPVPGIILSAENDNIAPVDDVKTLLKNLSKKRDCEIIHKTILGTDHFFADKLDEVKAILEDYINVCLAMRIAKPVRKKRRKRKKRDREYDEIVD